jgi:hypothetical protein
MPLFSDEINIFEAFVKSNKVLTKDLKIINNSKKDNLSKDTLKITKKKEEKL